MTPTEDDLAKAIVDYNRSREHDIVEIIEPEAHYHHYGWRGVPDLYIVFQRPSSLWEQHLYEIKSEYAVKAATGANEIIRQFNQMRRWFFEDDERYVREPRFDFEDVFLHFELVFIPTEYTILHIFDNKELYNEAIHSETPNPSSKLPKNQTNEGGVNTLLSLRSPTDRYSTPIISDNGTRLTDDDDPMEYIEKYTDA